ncbi:MAG: hypothetical protein UU47_C0006G0016 [candidate division TM6 bacterium GW2011_GWE2_41_16]|nr:MAG: hypothetical protein UU47_C0006G0016 [candidate division TM6 bacterium GW2011_GWE2_41_16]
MGVCNMRRGIKAFFTTCLALFIVGGAGMWVHKVRSKEIPLEDFFKNPERAAYTISPDGTHVAFLAPYKNRMNIFVQKIGDENAHRVTSVIQRDIANYGWKNDATLVYVRDTNGDENYHLFSVDKGGNEERDLTPFDGVKVSIVDDLEDRENEMLIQMNKRDKKVFDVFLLNITTGELQLVAQNPGNVTSWLTDHDGQVRVAIVTDGVNYTLLFRNAQQEPFKEIMTTGFKDAFEPQLFTSDNKNLYVLSNVGQDKKALIIFDPVSGKTIEKLFEHPDVDVAQISYSKKRKVLTTAWYITSKIERVFFDDEIKKIFERLESALPGYEIVIADKNKAEDKFIVHARSDRSRGIFYMYDKTTDVLTKLADVSPWLDENKLVSMKPISYVSRDGLLIHGYLTLPKEYSGKVPVIVHPHGGPWARDEWGYNPTVQFLANRGYAVLQMNFRGSTGYGKKFWEKSFKQWGKTMQDDVTDGAQWLIDQGIADPKRIAIYGGSYGGYAVLAGLAFTPDLYACGVDYVGVSNLFTLLKSVPEYWKPELDMLYEQMGHPEKDKALLEEVSPVFHAHCIKVPLFVVQGRMDPRVNIAESDQIVEALKKCGVDVQYMVKDNEGHGFRNEENKFDFYRAMEKFLAEHLK